MFGLVVLASSPPLYGKVPHVSWIPFCGEAGVADKVEVAPRVTVGSPKELFRRLVDWTDPRTPNGVSCSDTKA